MARRSYRPAIGEIAKSLLVLSGRQPGVVFSVLGTRDCIDRALGAYGALRSGPRIEEELKGARQGEDMANVYTNCARSRRTLRIAASARWLVWEVT